MHDSTPNVMDYTGVPVGLRIEGRLSSGQLTQGTSICPNCGRTGVITSPKSDRPMVVHTGSTERNTLTGIDVCSLAPTEASSET